MTYFPRYNGNSASISDALSAVGANGSYQSRQQIAAANGISNYTGTAAQNTQMLNMLKAGNLINPSGTSSSNDGRTTTTYVISDDGTITETTVPVDRTGPLPVDVTKPMGMNKWLKYGLIAGGVAVAGLLIYKLTKRKKKVEQKPTKKGKLNGTKNGNLTQDEIIEYYEDYGGLACKYWTFKEIKDCIKATFGKHQTVTRKTCQYLKDMATRYQRGC